MITINMVNSDTRQATLTFTAAELNVVANAVNKFAKEHPEDEIIHTVHQGIYLACNIVKNGCIDSVTVQHLNKIQDDIEKSRAFMEAIKQ